MHQLKQRVVRHNSINNAENVEKLEFNVEIVQTNNFNNKLCDMDENSKAFKGTFEQAFGAWNNATYLIKEELQELDDDRMKKLTDSIQINSKIRLLHQRQQMERIATIIVSFSQGMSYDNIYQKIEQKTPLGTQTLVYLCKSQYLSTILNAFQGKIVDQVGMKLLEYLSETDPAHVVFNWECCVGYSQKIFPQGQINLFRFLQVIIEKGYMAMFADFSLKALISKWPQNYSLGPNPFVQLQSTQWRQISKITLKFNKEQLKSSPSAQLQALGQLSEAQQCDISILGNTITFTIDKTKLQHDKYTIKVLTVVQSINIQDQSLRCTIGDSQGAAGHAILQFPSKGILLVSMGHWKQLLNIKTSQATYLKAIKSYFGSQYSNRMANYLSVLPPQKKKPQLLRNTINYIQSQAPCRKTKTTYIF